MNRRGMTLPLVVTPALRSSSVFRTGWRVHAPSGPARMVRARGFASGLGGALVVDAGELLARERLDRVHDHVGDLAPGAPGRHAGVPAREGERFTEPHRHVSEPRQPAADRLEVLGAD